MKRTWVLFSFAVALLVVTALVSVGIGAVRIGPGRLCELLFNSAQPGTHSAEATIFWQLRLPRVLLASLIGAGLGVAGAGYQGLFRNPLVDPFVIGASSGAAVGATLAIVAGWQGSFLGIPLPSVLALLGAVTSVAIVYIIAAMGSQVPTVSLLLTGVAVSSFLGSLVSLLMFLHDEQLMTIFGWLMGSFSGRGWHNLTAAGPLIACGGLALWFLSRPLDALTFGDETAATLGLSLFHLRGLVIFAASAATAASVSTAGIIGFVGLVAPHLARSLVGPRHALLFPMSALSGAILLLVADGVARTIVAPAEIPVGIVTALLGSPFFLAALKARLAIGRDE